MTIKECLNPACLWPIGQGTSTGYCEGCEEKHSWKEADENSVLVQLSETDFASHYAYLWFHSGQLFYTGHYSTTNFERGDENGYDFYGCLRDIEDPDEAFKDVIRFDARRKDVFDIAIIPAKNEREAYLCACHFRSQFSLRYLKGYNFKEIFCIGPKM